MDAHRYFPIIPQNLQVLIFFLFYFILFPVKGKECNTHADCSYFQLTSCVKDPDDHVHRCLCGNNKAPINGYCKDTQRGKITNIFLLLCFDEWTLEQFSAV